MKNFIIYLCFLLFSLTGYSQKNPNGEPRTNIGKSLNKFLNTLNNVEQGITSYTCVNSEERVQIRSYLKQIRDFINSLNNFSTENEASTEYIIHINFHENTIFSLIGSSDVIRKLIRVAGDLKIKVDFAESNRKNPYEKMKVIFHVIDGNSLIEGCFIKYYWEGNRNDLMLTNAPTKNNSPLTVELTPGNYRGWAEVKSKEVTEVTPRRPFPDKNDPQKIKIVYFPKK